MIKLIINADDFGYTPKFDKRILNLLEKGFIKSTTVMVDFVKKKQVKALIKLADKVSIGLHVVFDLKKPLDIQINNQFDKFIELFNFKPSHLDYHKYIGNLDCVKVVNKFAELHNLPVRHMEIKPKTKCTTLPVFVKVPFDLKATENFLDKLKDNQSCEVLCHPGEYDPNCKSSLNKEREQDYEGLIKLQTYLKEHPNIKNISYNEL